MNETEFQGRMIVVKKARPREEGDRNGGHRSFHRNGENRGERRAYTGLTSVMNDPEAITPAHYKRRLLLLHYFSDYFTDAIIEIFLKKYRDDNLLEARGKPEIQSVSVLWKWKTKQKG